MEEFKINSSLKPGSYVDEKGKEISLKELYNGHYMVSIGNNVVFECRNKDVAIQKIKKVSKFLKELERV